MTIRIKIRIIIHVGVSFSHSIFVDGIGELVKCFDDVGFTVEVGVSNHPTKPLTKGSKKNI